MQERQRGDNQIMTQENIIRVSGEKPTPEHAIKQNPAPQNTGTRTVQAYNDDLAKQMADALNEKNHVPMDMRPKERAKPVSVAVAAVEEEEEQNVIKPTAQQVKNPNPGAPKVFSGTKSSNIAGVQKQNVIKVGEPQKSGEGKILQKGRVVNVSPQKASSSDTDRAELVKQPQSEYLYINKVSQPREKRRPVGIHQEILFELLNSDDRDKMFETLKDDEAALREIKMNQAVFADCKHIRYLMDKFNEYKGNRNAWQRIRTR